MGHTSFSNRAAHARRYPRRSGKKECFVFRAIAQERRIDFIHQDQSDRPAGKNAGSR